MQKIKIKINIHNLNAILEVLRLYENQFNTQNLTFKAVLSISDDLYSKLMRKAITERKNDKEFNINLKYYEAFALEAILRNFITNNEKFETDSYTNNTALYIANQIHQNL